MTNDTYNKYLVENDQFFYDEDSSKKGFILKQDNELFNEDDYVPGDMVEVKRVSGTKSEDWNILINGKVHLVLKGSRFSSKQREFLRTPNGVLFIIKGAKMGWNSVSEFKRQLKEIE